MSQQYLLIDPRIILHNWNQLLLAANIASFAPKYRLFRLLIVGFCSSGQGARNSIWRNQRYCNPRRCRTSLNRVTVSRLTAENHASQHTCLIWWHQLAVWHGAEVKCTSLPPRRKDRLWWWETTDRKLAFRRYAHVFEDYVVSVIRTYVTHAWIQTHSSSSVLTLCQT